LTPSYDDSVRLLPPDALERSLALVGFMGIGKTTVGGELSSRLGWLFLDTDSLIETRSNMTVREIFDWFGEARFRELESEVVTVESARPQRILALGGGAFIQPANRDLLLERCVVVYLAAPWSHVSRSIHRLKNTRPLLRDRSLTQLHELFDARHTAYDQAHVRVSTPGRNPAQVANRILELIGLPFEAP